MDYQSFQPGGQNQNQNQTPTVPEISKPQNLNERLRPYKWHIAISGVIIIAILFGAYSYLKHINQQNDAAVAKQAEDAQKKIDEIIQKRSQYVTTTWQTYSNTQYGFEFKYPDDWTHESVDKSLFFHDPNQKDANLSGLFIGESDKSVSDAVNDLLARVKTDSSSQILANRNIQFAGQAAVEVHYLYYTSVGNSFEDRYIFVRKSNFTLIINYNVKDAISDQILSTFKFTGTSLPTPIPTATPVSDSGVSGTIIFRTCGGVFKAPPCSNEARPNVEIVIQKVADGSITRFNTSNTGTFKVSLKPGDYVIKKPDLGGLSGQDTPVKVTANNYSQVAITYSFLYP